MSYLSTLLALALAALSLFALYHPAQSIPKLQRYESKAEKAAKWSNIAEKKLQDTRYTVGAALVMVPPPSPSRSRLSPVADTDRPSSRCSAACNIFFTAPGASAFMRWCGRAPCASPRCGCRSM